MLFQEKVNEMFKVFDCLDDFNKIVDEKAGSFNELYAIFKKDHNLENLYFSKLISTGGDDYITLEVWYEISDLYLTYLEANDRLPKGIIVERALIKEEYLYNAQMYQRFMTSMVSAMEQQVEPEIVCGRKLYGFDAYKRRTEIIKLSNSLNELPDMIVERIPMSYDDLKNLSSK